MNLRESCRIDRFLLGGVFLFFISASAHAVYQYRYTGNIFQVTEAISICDIDPGACPPPPIVLPPTVYDVFVAATIVSPTLLTSGSPISTSGLTLSIAANFPSGGNLGELQFPYPADPMGPPGSSVNPFIVNAFDIGAVDSFGLPADWNISIDLSYAAPTGRFFFRNFLTSTTLDSVAGGYEGFSDFTGSIANHPGTWTVSVVPEPESYGMLLVGLGVLGFMVRHRRKHMGFPPRTKFRFGDVQ